MCAYTSNIKRDIKTRLLFRALLSLEKLSFATNTEIKVFPWEEMETFPVTQMHLEKVSTNEHLCSHPGIIFLGGRLFLFKWWLNLFFFFFQSEMDGDAPHRCKLPMSHWVWNVDTLQQNVSFTIKTLKLNTVQIMEKKKWANSWKWTMWADSCFYFSFLGK